MGLGMERSEEMGRPGQVACWATPVKTSPLPYTAIALGPKLILPPKARGLGGLKSEFLKQSMTRGFRTQDQPAGSIGVGRWLLRGGVHVGVCYGYPHVICPCVYATVRIWAL